MKSNVIIERFHEASEVINDAQGIKNAALETGESRMPKENIGIPQWDFPAQHRIHHKLAYREEIPGQIPVDKKIIVKQDFSEENSGQNGKNSD